MNMEALQCHTTKKVHNIPLQLQELIKLLMLMASSVFQELEAYITPEAF